MKVRPNVNNFFSITPNHYTYTGPVGWKHFHFMLCFLIQNVNNTDIMEINTVCACILFKGNDKDKQSDVSYKTISTCPLIVKALDLYIRGLNVTNWIFAQSECQVQVEGSNK
jgi:hypothetical protein